MTEGEIHDFGIEVVVKYLRQDGHEVVAVDANPAVNPQVVARIDGQLAHIFVRTACYPHKGTIDTRMRELAVAHARRHTATAYFASVGIANADGADDSEMARPVTGAGFYVSYAGLDPMVSG